MKIKIFTLLLTGCLFVSTSFAQESEVAYELPAPSITIFSSIQNAPYGIPYVQQYNTGLCFSLEYTDEYAPTFLRCGTGLTKKEIREQSRNTTQSPEFSIIDLQGNTVLVLEPDVTPCHQPAALNDNDSGNDSNNNSTEPAVIACGFGELNSYTPMCGQVCVDQTTLQPGYYIAIFKTNAGTVTKKFAIGAN